ncbi:MAG: diguanylate phosphodiesterase, partial [Thermodesulfobacteriota bacterium]|nr:diguanylate phosphodiesterase [Thermodesulfobacteriota bacterium]
LELLAGDTKACRQPTETMFLLGLFSLLDAMLGQSMGEIVGKLPLDPEVKAALIGQENELSRWLRLANAYERGDWEDVSRTMGEKDLSLENADGSYVQAMAWAQRILGKTGEEKEESG